LLQVREFRRLGHRHHERFPVGRFGQVIERAVLHGLNRAFDGPVRGENDHLAGRVCGAHFGEQFLAGHARHHQVGKHDVEAGGPQQLHRALSGRGLLNRKTLVAQGFSGYFALQVVVFNDQHR